MEGIWKTLAAPIIASVIGGMIVGLILARVNSPELPVISASSQAIDFPNPIYSADIKLLEEIEKFVNESWGASDIRKFLGSIRFDKRIRIVKFEIDNSTNLRSKDIEISGNSESGFLSYRSDGSQPAFSSKVRLKALDPNGSTTVFGAFGMLTSFFPPQTLMVHDGKKVDIVSKDLPGELSGLVGLIQQYPFFAFFVGVILAVTAIFLIIALPISIATTTSVELRAKLTSKQEMIKLIKFVEYMQKNHPEKLPDLPKGA